MEFENINRKTAARRKAKEIRAKRQSYFAYLDAIRKQMHKEKAIDRLWWAVLFGVLIGWLYSCYCVGLMPLHIAVPLEIVCASCAFGCVVDSIRLFLECRK